MKTLIAGSLLALCLLGTMTAPAQAQPIGPVCLEIVEFAEITEFFALPTGGDQLVLTGKSITFGDAYSGAGYIDGNDLIFSLSSGLLPGLLEGIINLSTGQGTGSITFADTGEIEALSYSIFSPPCVLF